MHPSTIRLPLLALAALALTAADAPPPAPGGGGARDRLVAGASMPWSTPTVAALRGSPRKVFAPSFLPFPLSIDNADPAHDYYATQFLTVDGERGKHAAY